MVNRVILIGSLGDAPDVRRLQNGTVVANVGLATTENWYDENAGQWMEKTEWHRLVFWRRQAEIAERNYGKGYTLYVEGKLTTDQWEDNDGNTRQTTKVVVNYARIVRKPGSDQRQAASNQGQGYGQPQGGGYNQQVQQRQLQGQGQRRDPGAGLFPDQPVSTNPGQTAEGWKAPWEEGRQQ